MIEVFVLLLLLVLVFPNKEKYMDLGPNLSGNYNLRNLFPWGHWVEPQRYYSNYKLARPWGGLWKQAWLQPWQNRWYTYGETHNKRPVFYPKHGEGD